MPSTRINRSNRVGGICTKRYRGGGEFSDVPEGFEPWRASQYVGDPKLEEAVPLGVTLSFHEARANSLLSSMASSESTVTRVAAKRNDSESVPNRANT